MEQSISRVFMAGAIVIFVAIWGAGHGKAEGEYKLKADHEYKCMQKWETATSEIDRLEDKISVLRSKVTEKCGEPINIGQDRFRGGI
ncbi:MAG: hypothetical protein HON43_04500 [Alphaproteobacteria bacterium]|jgi:hypothetical protein|nr:hypothetical protein [Alphaproteobacteria bacterium]MBT5390406.1 hypothetical protein [Alphaproteobacteria bacterium]MBT5540622.1 hypothetical protein [Alphaproteobacteria bacterium]